MLHALFNSSASGETDAHFVVTPHTPDEHRAVSLGIAAATVAAFGLLFQVGQFVEHVRHDRTHGALAPENFSGTSTAFAGGFCCIHPGRNSVTRL